MCVRERERERERERGREEGRETETERDREREVPAPAPPAISTVRVCVRVYENDPCHGPAAALARTKREEALDFSWVR